MKPLVAAHVVERAFGGIRTFVQLILESQSRDPAFAEVHLIADPASVGELADIPGIRIHYYESSRNPLKLPAVCRSVGRILKAISPDVVIAHSSFPGLYARNVVSKPKWAVIYCAHGWSFAQTHSARARFLYRVGEILLSRRTDAIINISNYETEVARKAGLNPSLLHTIPHGLPMQVDQVPPQRADDDRLRLIYVGRLNHKKGVDRLLAAFDHNDLSAIDLWLVGDVVEDDEGAPVIPQRGNIRVLGWLSAPEVESHIQSADAMVVPSRWEGFGFTALEAMRAGKPVLASNVGGLRELVTEGESGLFIDIQDLDGMRRTFLSLSRARLVAMGCNARTVFESRYSWQRCYDAWQSVIQNAVAQKKKRN